MILIFSLLFKANCEECVPPLSKKARVNNAGPAKATVRQYGSWPKPPKQVQSSVQECNAAGPSTIHHTVPGPSRAAPLMQGQEVALQHALPGPSDVQVQPGYKNVSIFSYLSISSNF